MQKLLRVNYFDKQFLRKEDFVAEQAYHIEQVRRLVRTLISAGVVEGLEVSTSQTPEGKPSITVSKGIAVDSLGRLIICDSPISLRSDNQQGKTVILAVRLNERAPNPGKYPDEQDYQATSNNTTQYTRVIEAPTFLMAPIDVVLEQDQIPLARISFDNNGFAQIDPSVRLESVTKGTPPAEAPQAVIDDVNGNFRVRGDLQVDGALRVGNGGFSQVWYAQDVTNDVQINENNRWLDIEGMSINVDLVNPAALVCQYTMNVQAQRQPITIAPPEEILYVVSTAAVNDRKSAVIRENESTSSSQKGTVPLNKVMQVLEPTVQARAKLGTKQRDNKWFKVRNEDGSLEGFVAAWIVQEYVPEGGKPIPENFSTYIVQSGETLNDIAIKQGLTGAGLNVNEAVQLLLSLNNLPNANIIAGQSLYLPKSISMTPIGNDFLALRLVVDDHPYSQSSSSLHPVSALPFASLALGGTLAVSLSAGQHTITLQWYKVGTAFVSWMCNTNSFGEGEAKGYLSGRSLTVTAYY